MKSIAVFIVLNLLAFPAVADREYHLDMLTDTKDKNFLLIVIETPSKKSFTMRIEKKNLVKNYKQIQDWVEVIKQEEEK